MKKLKVFSDVLYETGETLRDYAFMCFARRDPKYFSREGKIGFVNLIAFMLNFVKKSMQLEIDLYMKMVKQQETFSKQAFSEARQKISHEAFKKLFKITVDMAYRTEDMDTLKGMRIFAVDGTSLALENSPELVKHFGCSGRGSTSATARVSILYDVLNECIMDTEIEKFSCGEQELALRHIEKLKNMDSTNNLIIFDRGYASSELISVLSDVGIHFLMRVKRKFNRDIDALTTGEGTVTIVHDNKSYSLRVIKFLLDSGETETLITNLTEYMVTIDEFKDLYFKRWPIETRYDMVKVKLQLENFTGKTVLSVLQDFYASMYLSNMSTFAKYITDAKILKNNKNKGLKYTYKTNTNILIGKLKDNLILALLDENPKRRERGMRKVIAEIAKNQIPIRPGRQFERNIPRKKRFHMNKKDVL
ncbi:MAG TPA: IS4 family transposase [Clostridia bacterium]|nr:IS4 family transposase [Clostridia bacterium]